MSVVTPTILSSGQQMSAIFELISIEIVKEVNRIPFAQLILIDGDAAQQQFPISNSDFFEPGKEIEIKLRYEDHPENETTVFKGIVTKQSVEAGSQGSVLTVTLKDKALKLTLVRKNVIYREKPDHKIIEEIVTNGGLTAGSLDNSKAEHLELVQYDATDWDFVLSRAEMNGFLVNVNDGEFNLVTPNISENAQFTFEYGISDIYAFEIETDGGHQYPDVATVSWDIKEQKLTKVATATSFSTKQGNLDGAQIAKTMGTESPTFVHPVPIDPKDLQAWSDGIMSHNRLAMIRGYVSGPGIETIKPLDVIEIAGIGDRFNGKTLVTGIRHLVNEDGWETAVQFGLSPERFTQQSDISGPAAAGQLPPIYGLQIGVVAPFEEDPNNEFRIKVALSGMDSETGSIWARLASPDAGKDRGILFRPEPGDEVVVGFFNNDPRQAVVLGGMFSETNNPPELFEAPSEDNLNKGIVTRSGIVIKFIDDEKASILIETPEANKFILNDDEQKIEIADQHGNTLTMSADGIEIISANNLIIEASGDVEIKGSSVDIK